MTKETALNLIKEYTEIFRDRGLPEIASALHDRWPEDGSEKKAMRWLGFAQGVAWSSDLFSLEDIKMHSMRGSVKGE